MQFVQDDGVAVGRRQQGQRAPHFLGHLVVQHAGQRFGGLAAGVEFELAILVRLGQAGVAQARLFMLEHQVACDAK
jgi:hypothetical protein